MFGTEFVHILSALAFNFTTQHPFKSGCPLNHLNRKGGTGPHAHYLLRKDVYDGTPLQVDGKGNAQQECPFSYVTNSNAVA